MTSRLPLNPDMIRLATAADRLPVKELLRRCRTSKQFYAAFCNNQAYWISRAKLKLTNDIALLQGKSVSDIQKALSAVEDLEGLGKRRGYTVDAEDIERKSIETLAATGFEEYLSDILSKDTLYIRSAIEGAATKGDEGLVNKLLAYEKVDYRTNIVAALRGFARAGRVDLLRKYADMLPHRGVDLTSVIENGMEYLSQHPNDKLMRDEMIYLIDDDEHYMRHALSSAIWWDMPEFFDRYISSVNDEELVYALRKAVDANSRVYFDKILQVMLSDAKDLIDEVAIAYIVQQNKVSFLRRLLSYYTGRAETLRAINLSLDGGFPGVDALQLLVDRIEIFDQKEIDGIIDALAILRRDANKALRLEHLYTKERVKDSRQFLTDLPAILAMFSIADDELPEMPDNDDDVSVISADSEGDVLAPADEAAVVAENIVDAVEGDDNEYDSDVEPEDALGRLNFVTSSSS